MNKVIIGFFIALMFWFIMFSPITAQKVNFWAVMFFAGLVLSVYSIFSLKDQIKKLMIFNYKHLAIGVISAILLYFIFYIGRNVSINLFEFSSQQISSVYSTKQGTPIWLISVLLIFIIGPAEEIFWRGFIQTKIVELTGKPFLSIILATILYTIVHIWAFNTILLIAAFVCGLFWGIMFNKYNSLVPVIISHSLWDFTVFVLFPFN
ncbi:MAG: CPBP family intramembrane metalloprotease [Ignavibacteria bacterium]|nr:CPBP family intramembrane metalloprotease [Ignavibacteria bacterium]